MFSWPDHEPRCITLSIRQAAVQLPGMLHEVSLSPIISWKIDCLDPQLEKRRTIARLHNDASGMWKKPALCQKTMIDPTALRKTLEPSLRSGIETSYDQ